MMLPDQIEEIAARLKSGDITLLPTDSVWGVSCDAFNKQTIDRITKLKEVDVNYRYILLVNSLEMLYEYVEMMHPRIETLISLHNKPLTLIHTIKSLPDHLISVDGKIAMRITDNTLTQSVIAALGNPIISTTASLVDETIATTFLSIDDKIRKAMDFIPPFPHSLTTKIFEHPSVIAEYDRDGELEFIRT